MQKQSYKKVPKARQTTNFFLSCCGNDAELVPSCSGNAHVLSLAGSSKWLSSWKCAQSLCMGELEALWGIMTVVKSVI